MSESNRNFFFVIIFTVGMLTGMVGDRFLTTINGPGPNLRAHSHATAVILGEDE